MLCSIISIPLVCLLFAVTNVQALIGAHQSARIHSASRILSVAQVKDDADVLIYSDEFEDGVPPDNDENESPNTPWKRNTRWNSLHPKIKNRIVKEAQARAIANKKKKEPADVKKRRLLMMWKKMQRDKKNAARVKRPSSFDDRTPLSALETGMEMVGTVISLTNFGAYIDVGTECDGLLHISQMSNTFFVEHPRQVMSPGDEVVVRVTSTNSEKKKLQLSMLPVQDREEEEEDDDEDRIPLDEVDVDDELWGQIRRVTAYGAYVELGAVVDGFLHFMDHPAFADHVGESPNEFMTVGDRIRTWVSDVDMDKMRIKLTANRPAHLPGPRRELF